MSKLCQKYDGVTHYRTLLLDKLSADTEPHWIWKPRKFQYLRQNDLSNTTVDVLALFRKIFEKLKFWPPIVTFLRNSHSIIQIVNLCYGLSVQKQFEKSMYLIKYLDQRYPTIWLCFNLSNTLFERETPRHQYSKATIRKTNANRQYWRVNTEHTPLKISVFWGAQNRNTIPDSAKRTETARTLWRRALEPGSWKQFVNFVKHPKFQFTHKLTMNSCHNLTK